MAFAFVCNAIAAARSASLLLGRAAGNVLLEV